jgi:hypothetical protein
MDKRPARTDASWILASMLAAAGAAFGLAGVLAGWFRVDVYAKSDIFGTQLLASKTFSGLEDVTGLAALAAGFIVVLVVFWQLLLRKPGPHRSAAILAIVGGLAMFAAAILGFTRTGSVADAATLGAVGDRTGTVALGLWISAAGGLLAATGGVLAWRSSSASG